jgi:hypothetical protein
MAAFSLAFLAQLFLIVHPNGTDTINGNVTYFKISFHPIAETEDRKIVKMWRF